jgi:PBP1b-binding outer membrane lipoprotein LpoB
MVRSIAAILIAALLAGCSATTKTSVAKRGAGKPLLQATIHGVSY